MNEYVKEANRRKIEAIIKNLEKRNMSGYYCDSIAEAKEKILSMIEDEDLVSWGGSASLDQLGIKDELKNVLSNVAATPEEAYQNKRKAFMADVYLTGTNAITLDGTLVNIDMSGNRVAAICFGPEKVLVVAGVNKIAEDEAAALARIRTEACVPNAIRIGLKNPCAVTGKCAQCLGKSMCCHIVTTRSSAFKDRIHVIMVNEELGF